MAPADAPLGRAGVRTLATVEAVAARLAALPGLLTAEELGSLAALEWVAGHRSFGPVSGFDTMERPNDAIIRAEERAARRKSTHEDRDGSVRRFAAGVASALAWVLGETDEQP
ncbi:hypothetical protein [Kitasatospora sp. NPDC048538]|uniref:hypothetical protein n=1 Tax=unclassified Kitasatospora TaxID=2633591 RepID=UPI0033EF16BF